MGFNTFNSSAPCKNCEKKGCGSYHDKCKAYQNFTKRKTELIKLSLQNRKYLRKGYLSDSIFKSRGNRLSTFKNKTI